jgi:hypothetical protein
VGRGQAGERHTERQLVWCQANRGAHLDRHHAEGASVGVPVCLAAEAASLSTNLDRIPAVAGVL